MKPLNLTCPRCHAGPLARCEDPDGYTHRERAEAWALAQPKPPPKPIAPDPEPEAAPELPPNRGGGKQTLMLE